MTSRGYSQSAPLERNPVEALELFLKHVTRPGPGAERGQEGEGKEESARWPPLHKALLSGGWTGHPPGASSTCACNLRGTHSRTEEWMAACAGTLLCPRYFITKHGNEYPCGEPASVQKSSGPPTQRPHAGAQPVSLRGCGVPPQCACPLALVLGVGSFHTLLEDRAPQKRLISFAKTKKKIRRTWLQLLWETESIIWP